jgi:hypothetical protein
LHCGVTGSEASNKNRNLARDIGSVYKVARQASDEHADLVFKFMSSKLGYVEIGIGDRVLETISQIPGM